MCMTVDRSKNNPPTKGQWVYKSVTDTLSSAFRAFQWVPGKLHTARGSALQCLDRQTGAVEIKGGVFHCFTRLKDAKDEAADGGEVVIRLWMPDYCCLCVGEWNYTANYGAKCLYLPAEKYLLVKGRWTEVGKT